MSANTEEQAVREVKALVEDVREELRQLKRAINAARESKPLLYPLPQAAKMLGIGKTKLRELIKAGVVLISPALKGHPMMPASEIARLAHVEPPAPKVAKTTAKKARAPEVNAATQDPDALRRRRTR